MAPMLCRGSPGEAVAGEEALLPKIISTGLFT